MENLESLHLSVAEGYDRWSEFYDQDDIPLHILEEDVVDQHLGDVKGLRVLDLACGTGRQTVRLYDRGAQITGVDVSEGMLAKARAKAGDRSITFLQGNLDEGLPFSAERFDRVVSFLALEHFTDLKRLFSEAGRIVTKNGFIYFTVMHPAMTLKGVQARYTEDNGRKVYPKSFPYQISDYLNAAVAAGLKLQQISEHATDTNHTVRSARALKYEGWPLLLTMKFTAEGL